MTFKVLLDAQFVVQADSGSHDAGRAARHPEGQVSGRARLGQATLVPEWLCCCE